MSTIQIGYVEDGIIKAFVLHIAAMGKLPARLASFFSRDDIIFVGKQVKTDIERIFRDFEIDGDNNALYDDLAQMAKKRGVINDARVGLGKLCELILRKHLPKPENIRLSDWDRTGSLDRDQISYAAYDAIVSLEIYLALKKIPDLRKRLTIEEAIHEVAVDVVINQMDVCATGKINQIDDVWVSPHTDISPNKILLSGRERKVEITQVFKPNMKIPKLMYKNRSCALGDFVSLNERVFEVVLPISMLRINHSTHRHQHASKENREISKAGLDSHRSVTDTETKCVGTINHEQIRMNNEDINNEEQEHALCEGTRDIYAGFLEDEIEELQEGDFENEITHDVEDNVLVTLNDEQLKFIFLARSLGLNYPPQFVREGSSLGAVPSKIVDKKSAVLSDVFHLIHRVKVPVHHELKKAYHHSIREAFFVWDQEKLEALKKAMIEKDGITTEDFNKMLYFNASFMLMCVPRYIPPPSQLYFQVRAVYELFGHRLDSKTGCPLFNDRNYRKAKEVLDDILSGYASDPPGFVAYTEQYDSSGRLICNRLGFPILNCHRGTKSTECVHKQLLATFHSWHTGLQMSSFMLAEFRHRYNHNTAMTTRMGYPKIGH